MNENVQSTSILPVLNDSSFVKLITYSVYSGIDASRLLASHL